MGNNSVGYSKLALNDYNLNIMELRCLNMANYRYEKDKKTGQKRITYYNGYNWGKDINTRNLLKFKRYKICVGYDEDSSGDGARQPIYIHTILAGEWQEG